MLYLCLTLSIHPTIVISCCFPLRSCFSVIQKLPVTSHTSFLVCSFSSVDCAIVDSMSTQSQLLVNFSLKCCSSVLTHVQHLPYFQDILQAPFGNSLKVSLPLLWRSCKEPIFLVFVLPPCSTISSSKISETSLDIYPFCSQIGVLYSSHPCHYHFTYPCSRPSLPSSAVASSDLPGPRVARSPSQPLYLVTSPGIPIALGARLQHFC